MIRLAPLLSFLAALVAALAPAGLASAATRTLSWNDDAACTFRISFDPAKHDAGRLHNTIRLLFVTPDYASPIVGHVADPPAIARLDLPKFERQCGDLLKKVRDVELSPFPGIEDLRRAVAAEIEDSCKFGNAEIRGLRNPQALRDYTSAPSCTHFIDALEGKTDIDKLFRETVTETCRNNASPQRCRDDILKDAQKPDGKERMRLFLTTFGWSQCANKHTIRYRDTVTKLRASLEKQFKRMFTVRSKCENPG
jgi:hypothetical protein